MAFRDDTPKTGAETDRSRAAPALACLRPTTVRGRLRGAATGEKRAEALGWYRVVKTIKGHRYLYEQRTWREGKHVRTESRYIGPADGGGAPERGDRARRETEPVNTTARTLFHGSRVGIAGVPEPSEQGTFGPGFYLTSKERAERYATFTAKTAANPEAYGSAGERFEGTVYAIEIGHLNLKVLTWDDYLDLCEKLDPAGAATPSAKAKLQGILLEEGYDGLEIRDARRPEVVIFPAAVYKLSLVNTTETRAIPEDLRELAEQARKYTSAEEFVNNYNGGLMLNREKFNNFISGGPENEVKLSHLLTKQGQELFNDTELPDISVIVEEDAEEVMSDARLNWNSDEGIKSARIYVTISPFEEDGVQDLAYKEWTILHELTHVRQLMLNKADNRAVDLLEKNADKSAEFRYQKLKSKLIDLYNRIHKLST